MKRTGIERGTSRLRRARVAPVSARRRGFLRAWPTRRAEILARDHYRCRYCGEWASEVHHVVKRSQSTALLLEADNLVALCADCHRWTDEAGAGPRGRLLVDALGMGRFAFCVREVDKFTARAQGGA